MAKRKSDALDFQVGEAPWLVQAWPAFAGFFGVQEFEAAAFYDWLCREQAELSGMVRMLYGIRPAIPTGAEDERYQRIWGLDEVAAELATSGEQVRLMLAMIREGWVEEKRRNPVLRPEPEPPKERERTKARRRERESEPEPAPPAYQGGVITEDASAVLRAYGFGPDIFDLYGRSEQTRHAEIEWFCARLEELKRVFEEPMAKTLARQAILNELSMRRIDDEMTKLPPAHQKFWDLQETKRKIESTYLSQWQQLEASCPFIKSMQTKAAFAGVVSEFLDAYRSYRADRSNELVDGLFTSMEIQILLRASQQDPNVRYRPELSIAWNEAKRCLWDPRFRSQFEDPKKPGTYPYLGLLSAGFQGAIANFMEKTGLKLPDLESDGPEGEFPKLFIPEVPPDAAEGSVEVQSEIVIPEAAVEIGNR